MHQFNSLREVAQFFDQNYNHFLRYDDHTLDYNGVTYLMELDETAPVPLVRVGYFDDDGDLSLLLCIVDFGLLINTDVENEGDKPEIYEYLTILDEQLFDLNIYDLARFNYILKRAVKDM
jgi:hypothetical protein